MQGFQSIATLVSSPAGRAVRIFKRSSAGLADADIILTYCLAIIFAAVVGKWIGSHDASVLGVGDILNLADINAGEALAVTAMVSITYESRRILSLTSLDFLVIIAGALFFLPPAPPSCPFLGATLAGLYFWRARGEIPALASLGQLWIAISTHAAWGPFVFRTISAPILRLETLMIAVLGHVAGLGLVVQGAQLAAPSGWSVYILGPCSSFHNLSLAVLVWLSLLKLAGGPIKASGWAALVVGAALVIVLNMVRILLMTLSEAHYEYWHDGSGRNIFICLTFAAIAVPTVFSRRSTRRGQVSAAERWSQ